MSSTILARADRTVDRHTTTARNANLADIAALLQDRHARRHDLVVPASMIQAWQGKVLVKGSEPQVSADGVTSMDGFYTPTDVADDGLSDKFSIPRAYLRRLREERPTLLDATLNHHIRGGFHPSAITNEPDERSFLLRTLLPEDGAAVGTPGILRAFLSDRYAIQDDFDILLSVLQAVKETGLHVNVDSADLTERRMHLRLSAPEITAMAPALLEGYRSPYRSEHEDSPIVSVGLRITNSEVGAGAFGIAPEVRVLACDNGLVVTKSIQRQVHLGAKMEAGQVNWSQETMEKNAALIASRTKDAIKSFLNPVWLAEAVHDMTEAAGKPVETVDQVKDVTKSLGFTQAQMDLILGDFIRGGSLTLGGVANAITSASQRVENADDAYAMDLAAGTLLGV